jgi:hypothetical protein
LHVKIYIKLFVMYLVTNQRNKRKIVNRIWGTGPWKLPRNIGHVLVLSHLVYHFLTHAVNKPEQTKWVAHSHNFRSGKIGVMCYI